MIIRTLIDTNVWAWAMTEPQRLSDIAVNAMDQSREIFVSPVSFYEVSLRAWLGKWPAMAARLSELDDSLERMRFVAAPLDREIMLRAGSLDWDHRDPFDRMLAATALTMNLRLVSTDTAFDAVPGMPRRIW